MRLMRFRTWPVAALGLGGLLLLVVVSVLAASNRAQEIYTQLDQLNTHQREVETKLRALRSDVHLSGIFIRDYLLDSARENAAEYRQRLAEFRQNNLATVAELAQAGKRPARTTKNASRASKQSSTSTGRRSIRSSTGRSSRRSARAPASCAAKSCRAARPCLRSRRRSKSSTTPITRAARRSDAPPGSNYAASCTGCMWGSLLLGIVVALTAVIRLRVLERRSENERAVAEEAEHQMRQLSQQLVATQEEERKKLSRELHDHVGQMLTALRMELGRIDRLRTRIDSARITRAGPTAGSPGPSPSAGSSSTTWCARCAILRSGFVRACWTTSACSRRSSGTSATSGGASASPSSSSVDGDLDHLTERQRTCVYRIVQEALTNCVRHSRATRVAVSVSRLADSLNVTITDDGVGFDPAQRGRRARTARHRRARARAARHVLKIRSAPGAGTTLTMTVPLATQPAEIAHARAAG